MRLALLGVLLATPLAAQQPAQQPAPVPPPPQPAFAADSAAVVGIVKNLFNGMRTRDTALMRAQFHSSATMRSVSYDRTAKAVVEEDGPSDWIGGVGSAPATLFIDERLGPPTVHVDGNLATVWVYYELWVGDRFSHCGADVFTLVRTEGKWRIASLAWSAEQPPVCEKHPAGPPKP